MQGSHNKEPKQVVSGATDRVCLAASDRTRVLAFQLLREGSFPMQL